MNVPYNPPPAPAPKKKLSPLAWMAIGCGGLIVLGMLALAGTAAVGGFFLKKKLENPTMAAAELIVRANPELEMVSSDPDKSTMTIRNKTTGEEVTLNAEDIKEGRISFETKDGTATFDASGSSEDGQAVVKVTDEKGQESTILAGDGAPKDLPSWLPVYPGGQTQGSFDTRTEGERSAAFAVSTKDPADQVMSFYEEKLKAAGLTVEKQSYAQNDKTSGGIVTGKSDDEKRNVNVMVSASEDGSTQATVTFTEKSNP